MSGSAVVLEPDRDVQRSILGRVVGDRAAAHGFHVREVHRRPDRGLGIFQLLAGADAAWAVALSAATARPRGAGWEGKASNSVGWYHSQLGDQEKALRYFERALALHQEARDPANQALVRDNLGQAHAELGRHDAAVDHYEHGLRLARALGESVLEAELLVHLGDAYQALGDLSSARERWQDAQRLLTDAGHPQAADLGHKLAGTVPGAPDDVP